MESIVCNSSFPPGPEIYLLPLVWISVCRGNLEVNITRDILFQFSTVRVTEWYYFSFNLESNLIFTLKPKFVLGADVLKMNKKRYVYSVKFPVIRTSFFKDNTEHVFSLDLIHISTVCFNRIHFSCFFQSQDSLI